MTHEGTKAIPQMNGMRIVSCLSHPGSFMRQASTLALRPCVFKRVRWPLKTSRDADENVQAQCDVVRLDSGQSTAIVRCMLYSPHAQTLLD